MRVQPLFASALLSLAACTSSPAAQDQPQGPPPPGEVGIVTVKTEQVTLQTELAGRTTASLTSELRPQVTGIVKARTFEEGAHVKAGQVLYQIDAAMYRATYDQATADLASAKASLESSKAKNERYVKLSAIEGVSKQEADDARASFQQATAQVAQKQAALQAARINLDYTAIKAPINGRIGKSSVTAGALVTANQAEPLATIRSLDPIYVDLTESSEERLKLRAQLGAGGLQAGSTRVKLKLGDGSLYPLDGKLEFTEVAVVRAVLDQAVDQAAILVPQQGVMHDPKGNATAMVVAANGTVEARTIVADRAIGDRWLVTSGLAAGDKLIVEGLNKIGPGMPVHATEVTLPVAAPPGAPKPDAAKPAAGK